MRIVAYYCWQFIGDSLSITIEPAIHANRQNFIFFCNLNPASLIFLIGYRSEISLNFRVRRYIERKWRTDAKLLETLWFTKMVYKVIDVEFLIGTLIKLQFN